MSLLSRVAERMYWSSRYLERAENTARLIRVYGNLLLDLPRETGLGWEQLIEITGSREPFEASRARMSKGSAEHFLISDPDNANSLVSCLTRARENIRTTRDIVPSEAWRCTNELVLYARANLEAGSSQRRRGEAMLRIIEGCQQITGLLHGTMSRGTAYQFIRVGRNLERADMTTRIIDVAAATLLTGRRELLRFDNRLWMSVLQSLGAYQMYRQHVRRRIMGPDVIAYLLKDELFPRALNHCLRELKAALAAFPGHDSSLDSIGAVEALVLGLALEDIGVQRLHQWIDDVQLALGDLDGRIHGHWFLPAAVG